MSTFFDMNTVLFEGVKVVKNNDETMLSETLSQVKILH
jgi:hypothetical protein